MTDTPHLTLADAAKPDAAQLADALRDAMAALDPATATVVSRLLDHHLATLEQLERAGRAIAGLDKLDDIRHAQMTVLQARVELLERRLGRDDDDTHSRKVS